MEIIRIIQKHILIEYYNYADEEAINNVGGDGYFGRHVVTTKNAEYETYADDITMWQTDVDISLIQILDQS